MPVLAKSSFDEVKLWSENVRAFMSGRGHEGQAQSGAKGAYVKKVSVSSTMGPGVKLDPDVDYAVGRRRKLVRPM